MITKIKQKHFSEHWHTFWGTCFHSCICSLVNLHPSSICYCTRFNATSWDNFWSHYNNELSHFNLKLIFSTSYGYKINFGNHAVITYNGNMIFDPANIISGIKYYQSEKSKYSDKYYPFYVDIVSIK